MPPATQGHHRQPTARFHRKAASPGRAFSGKDHIIAPASGHGPNRILGTDQTQSFKQRQTAPNNHAAKAARLASACFAVLTLIGLSLPAAAAPSSAYVPNGFYSYDAAILDNPYLRSNDFYGYDKVDTKEDTWTDLFGDFRLPILTNIGVAGFYDDNVLLNNLNRKSSFGTRLTPSITLPFGSEKFVTVLNYSLMANVFENVSYADTVSNYLTGTSTLQLDHRNRLTLTARGAFAQDPLGTMFSQGAIANIIRDPNTWSGYGINGLYQYGAAGAEGNLNLKFAIDNREYSNNPEITRQRDLNSYMVGGSFLWRAMPKTQILFEVDDTILDYLHNLNAGGSLNGSMYRTYTGATWQATAKTRAVAKVGYQWRTYDDPNFQNRSGPAFQGMLHWQPADRDAVWVELSNAINESLIFNATSTEMQTYNLNWQHQWLARVSTSLGAFYMQQQYTDSNITNDTVMARISAIYTFRQGVWADLQYTYTDRSSSQNQFDYNQNLVLLNFRVLF